MKPSNLRFLVALAVSSIVIVLFLSSSPLLTLGLDKADSIPLGTFITWAGMIAFPLTIYWSAKELRRPTNRWNSILVNLLKIIIGLGILWVPIAYLLAGNIAFNFSNQPTFQGGQTAMRYFWRLSYGIPIGAILILVIFWISSMLIKGDNNSHTS